MNKKPLVVVSILIVVLLILGSIVNVVGYHTVQKSQNYLIKEDNNPKELLFQTVLDIANNKDIQKIIQKSQMNNGKILEKYEKLSKPITKQQIRRMYFIGHLFSKRISKTNIQSMIQKYQLITPEMQQKIDAVIANDAILNEEIGQLLNYDCDCNDPETTDWGFPIICAMLLIMMGLVTIPWVLLVIISMIPPSAWDEMIELLFLILSPFIILYQLFNCPVPEETHDPFISDISPVDNEQNVLLNLTELSFRLTDHDGDLMSYKVTTDPYIGEGEGELVPNGTYTIPISGLQHSTRYTWEFYLYEGDTSGTPFASTYTFTTAPIAPVISNLNPKNNAPCVPVFKSNLSFDLTDYQGDLMDWTVETQPDIGSGAGNGVGNGRFSVDINGLDYENNYTWFVNVTDGTNWTRKTFVFTVQSEGLLIFEPSGDTYVYLYSQNSNYGSRDYLELYNNNRSLILISFDLSEIPAGYTINSANLCLYYYNYDLEMPVNREIICHRILENWDEMTVTQNTMPPVDPVPCASTILPGNNDTWINWNVTYEVNDFVNRGIMNYGWLLRDYKPFSDHNINHFYYSRNANNDFYPRLFVWLTPLNI